MEVVIRALDERDVERVVDLSLRAWAPVHVSIADALGPELNDALNPDWRASQAREVRAACTDGEDRVWVAEIDKIVVGFVAVRVWEDRRIGEIDLVAVDPATQNTGVETALTEFAIDWIRAEGVPVAMVGTGSDPGHAPARRTYEKAGMKLVPMSRYFLRL